MIPFEELVRLHNTVQMVVNPHWRDNFTAECALVAALVYGQVEDLTPKGWELVNNLLADIKDVSPLTILNPKNLPTF